MTGSCPLRPESGKTDYMLNRRCNNGISRCAGFVLGVVMLLCGLSATIAKGGEKPALQVLVVTTADWSAVDANVRLYERQDARSAWIPAGEMIPAVVGRNGLAWGRGVHPDLPAGGAQKKEGDGRAPAGIFRLGPAFGYAPGESVPWIGLPYRQMTESSKCVDDPTSPAYNRLVDERNVRRNWNSFEDMKRRDEQYRWGIVIGHNTDPVAPGGGSCIFLHIWDRPSKGTSGCTAVSSTDMEEILRKLRPGANPLLIQLPQGEYERLRGSWGLP
jgi:L,D-peptidoglycan transpeptidase YkuD (ErfK/YbiS/YcfS/YnhG family)